MISTVGWTGRNFFFERKFDAIPGDGLDPPKTDSFAVAQFVKLARLRAQHTAQVMSGLAFDDRAAGP